MKKVEQFFYYSTFLHGLLAKMKIARLDLGPRHYCMLLLSIYGTYFSCYNLDFGRLQSGNTGYIKVPLCIYLEECGCCL